MAGLRVKRAYRYRCYPTPEQAQELVRTFGCVRLVYNRALEARTAAWYGEQRRVSYVQSSAMLTEWKRGPELAFLNEVSSVPLQQSLRHLQGAFVAFWDKRARFPRFKRKRGRQSAEYTRSAFRWRNGQLTLARITEPLGIVWSRPLPDGAEPSTVTGDAAWSQLRAMLLYKCRWYGRELIVIDRWYPSSKVCSACGALQDTMPLGVREWTCRCGATHDRDVNAARSILAAGLAVAACGDGVRPAHA